MRCCCCHTCRRILAYIFGAAILLVVASIGTRILVYQLVTAKQKQRAEQARRRQHAAACSLSGDSAQANCRIFAICAPTRSIRSEGCPGGMKKTISGGLVGWLSSTQSLERQETAAATSGRISCWDDLSSTSLQTQLIPSIQNTVSAAELKKWDVRLYLGIDDDDEFWKHHIDGLQRPLWLRIIPGFYHKAAAHRVPFNSVTADAFHDGAEYIARINDDTQFLTPEWITLATNTLMSQRPRNVGVVGREHFRPPIPVTHSLPFVGLLRVLPLTAPMNAGRSIECRRQARNLNARLCASHAPRDL